MKTRSIYLTAFLIAFGVCSVLNGAGGYEKMGKDILQKADSRLWPDECSCVSVFEIVNEDGSKQNFKAEGYKQGRTKQTMVFTEPAINKNDVGIRSGDTIYYKPLKANKPSIMSYQAVFVDSAFCWGDVMSADMAVDYDVTNVDVVKEGGRELYCLVLKPNKTGLYARIDIWVDKGNYDTVRRKYYTASGELLKTSEFSGITEKDGQVVAFKIEMQHFIMNVKTTVSIQGIVKERLPMFLFDPLNISRVHARR